MTLDTTNEALLATLVALQGITGAQAKFNDAITALASALAGRVEHLEQEVRSLELRVRTLEARGGP